jgi:hypothetical protein
MNKSETIEVLRSGVIRTVNWGWGVRVIVVYLQLFLQALKSDVPRSNCVAASTTSHSNPVATNKHNNSTDNGDDEHHHK